MAWNEALEAAARTGDSAAIADLAATALPQMIAAARRLMGQGLRARETSTDVAMSAYGEALEHLSRMDYQGRAELRAWLVAHVAHKVRNKARYHAAERRAIAREEAGSDLDELATKDDPIAAAAFQDEFERVQSAMREICDGDRRLLALNLTAGLDLKQTAEALGITHGAARARKIRALARLKAHLEEANDNTH